METIYGPRSRPCARIERWVLRLQPYDFSVMYRPGRGSIADSLSRLLHRMVELDKHEHDAEEYVRLVAVNATPRALTTREIEEASAVEEELIEVRTSGQFDVDTRRGASYSNVEVGDEVLVQQDKTTKLSTAFYPNPFKVFSKSGNSVIIESSSGSQ